MICWVSNPRNRKTREVLALFSELSNEVDPLTDPLDSVLAELEQFGKANDASTTERPRRMLNITRDTGEFLAVLVRATLARRVQEIGTSKAIPRCGSRAPLASEPRTELN